ncbi:MAG: LemA family protein [Thermoanaerobaculum sp.]|nr:LemA family protein [Thermoanaerobaculum sp.]MCX7895883.1 LemA family protein [Thermoanaerobaculum sp.]MDW7967541.1 LemA family protein [Thermoanaerobaculum sp.]
MKRVLVGCLAVVVVLALVAGLTLWRSYNQLVRLDEAVKAAWAQVENVYQRRADLIPNLVETVKGARDFERETLTAVVEARAKVGQVRFAGVPSAQEFAQFQKAQEELSSALSRLLVVVERYPELRATEAFRDLQAQLEGTENRIAVERRRFNEVAQQYNTYRRRFPQVLLANLLGFAERPYFQAAPGAERPPQVRF